jgi:signal transduction histidine kinase
LRPKVLDEFGLIAALEWQSEEFSLRTGIKCRMRAPSADLTLPTPLATELFRMFQGILVNVSEHAEARSVTVEVKHRRTWLFITVRDDGRGITREQIDSPKSLGLLELKERARSISAQLDMVGAPGIGTTMSIKALIPMQSTRPEGSSSDTDKSRYVTSADHR